MQLTLSNYDRNQSSKRSFSDSFFTDFFNSAKRAEKCSNFPLFPEFDWDVLLGELEPSLKYSNGVFQRVDLDDKSVFEILAPGRDKQDFTVKVRSNDQKTGVVLQVCAKSQKHQDNDSQRSYVSKFAKEDIDVSISLPAKYNFDMATCMYENGILKIEVPFLEHQESSVKMIPVN